MNTFNCPIHGERPLRVVPMQHGLAPLVIPGCRDCSHELAVQERKAEAAAEFAELRKTSGIEKHFHHLTLAGYPAKTGDQHRALIAVRMFVEDYENLRLTAGVGSWLLLHGWVGAGKTGLACAGALELMSPPLDAEFKPIRPRRSAIYHTLDSMRSWVWDARARGSSETEAKAFLAGCELLIIDEVGATTASDPERALLRAVVDSRSAKCRPLIVITNLEIAQLMAYDRAIYDRINQRATQIPCKWTSLRSAA